MTIAALQSWIVAAVVALAAGYSLWTLMPAAWRRRLARWPMLQSAAATDGGCSGCGGSCPAPRPGAATPGVSVIRGPQRSQRR